MLIALIPVFLLTELLFQIFLGYPPTADQLKLGIDSPTLLWGSRVLGFLLIGLSFYLISKLIQKNLRNYFLIFISASPTIAFLWMTDPVESLKVSFVLISFYISARFGNNLFRFGVPLATVLLLNLVVFNQKPEFVTYLNPNVNQAEVTHRFTREDSLKPNISVPTPLRRIGYNKYYLSLKNIGNLSMPFFNLETLFFQEVHPRHQKATVMFFWPEVFIFLSGLWILVAGKFRDKNLLLGLFIASFLYFLTTSTSIEKKLVLLIPTISLLMAEAVSSTKTVWQKRIIIFFLCLGLYGWATNVFDRVMRPGYWYDNRPIVYQFAFESIPESEGVKKIIFAETLYSAKDYCPYYKVGCENIVIENFKLGGNNFPEPETIYIGFLGNFLGPNPESNFPGDFVDKLEKTGLRVITSMRTYDNIANTYGQDVIVAEAIK